MSMFERLAEVELDSPVLVMGMEGWIDAGLGGGAAMATLVDQVPNQVVVRFDTDLLLDQRARRPVLRIVDGVTSPLNWPEIELRAGEDRSGKSVLLLVGPEPDMQWRAFTKAVVGLATEMGVRLAVGLGAFPAPVPHTRPTRLASTATTTELASKVGFVPGTIDVPAGIHAALERGFAESACPPSACGRGCPTTRRPCRTRRPRAALIDGADVRGRPHPAHRRPAHRGGESPTPTHRQLIANSEEHTAMVNQLEAQIDASEGTEAAELRPGQPPVGRRDRGRSSSASSEARSSPYLSRADAAGEQRLGAAVLGSTVTSSTTWPSRRNTTRWAKAAMPGRG